MNLNNVIKILPLVSSTLLFSAYADNAFAKDYYVATWGNDSAAGALSSPFRTIAKASKLVSAGDRAIIRAGNYSERIVVQRSGASGRPITYMAYPNEKVTINGSGVSVPYWGGLVDVNSKSFITLQGLNVVNSSSNGIFGYQVANIVVTKCSTYNTVSSGIGMQTGRNITVTGNDIGLANTTGQQENLTIASVNNFEVSYNHVHDGGKSNNGGEGIVAKGDSHNGKIFGNRVHGINRGGIYVGPYAGWFTDVQIYNNTVYSNAADGILIGNEAGGYLEDVDIYNNVVYNNAWSGIHVWGGGEAGHSHAMGRIHIKNNTVVKNGWGAWDPGIVSSNPNLVNLGIINNLVSQNTGIQIQITTALAPSHYIILNNLVDNSHRGWKRYGDIDKFGNNVVNALPNFIDAKNNNYRIATNSPAVGKGLSASGLPTFDYAFKARGGSMDIGAFQH
ncbi:MAG: right-handed parallel beta-helix repeat-containing protein [Methyloglobulus sp.]|nr:hypothetical protein [Methyloglobulus sp.]